MERVQKSIRGINQMIQSFLVISLFIKVQRKTPKDMGI